MDTTYTFEANGKTYKTDLATLTLLREFRETNNVECGSVVLSLGIMGKRIVEVR